MRTEYKVIPAPEKARKVRGLKGPALFAHAMEELMNELAQDGWTYLRADTLPQEERSGLTNKTTTYRNLLVFQRIIMEDAPAEPAQAATPRPTPEPTKAPTTEFEDDDHVTNLWHPVDDDPDDGSQPLVADR